MRYISVPEDIQMLTSSKDVCKVQDPVTRNIVDQPPVSFKQFVLDTLLFDEKWAQSYAFIRSARKIEEAVGKSNGVMTLEDSDWEKLKLVCEQPTGGKYIGFNALGMRNLYPYLETIIAASDKPLS